MSLQLNAVTEKLRLGGQKIKSLPQTFKQLPKKKQVLFSAVAALLVVVIVLSVVFSSKDAVKTINTAFVSRGDISVIISGTGTIKPIDEYEVTSLVKGEILADTFVEGDMVEKGDLLYQIDSSDLENTLEKAQLNLQKSQLSYNQTMEELKKLNVTSGYSGTITEMYIKVGDSVNSGTKIADLVNMDTLVLSLPFNEVDAQELYIGSAAEVTLANSFYRFPGTVRRISSGSLISAEGVTVRMVDIEVQNPGAIAKGESATATVGNVACNGPGTFDYKIETTIKAEASGEVVSLPVGKGDMVSAGSVVAVLESSSAASTRLNSQISLRDSQLSIENYNKQLEDYQITAPISGTVLKKTSKAGDTLDNSNSQVVMAVIADMSTIVFEMSVDELDISKIEVGQEVSVTTDAVENRVYSGFVDYVSVVGTTQNGVTTYPITVVVENPVDLIPGMNVSAEIVVESREDVLRVPVSAVNRGNIVYVKADGSGAGKEQGDGTSMGRLGADAGKMPEDAQGERPEGMPERPMPEQQGEQATEGGKGSWKQAGKGMMGMNVPEGFRAVRVETGLNDSDYIEIISGLSEGDEVYITVTTNGSSEKAMRGMMGMGAMGGGMPGGGMPGGGMPGGR